MRKSFLFTLLLIIFLVPLTAQVLYPSQPKKGYYENLKTLVIPLVPTTEQLVNAQASPLPEGFKDTLLKYDWYEIADYYVYDKSYSSYFSKDLSEREEKYANNEFEFKRYTPTGITYEMKLNRYKDGSIKVFTTTFEEDKAVQLVEIKKVKTKNMMVTSIYGESEMQEIISFKEGVMIMKIRQTPNTNTKIFIIAYLAVPKTF